MTNHFPSDVMYPNPECGNGACRAMQVRAGSSHFPSGARSDPNAFTLNPSPLLRPYPLGAVQGEIEAWKL